MKSSQKQWQVQSRDNNVKWEYDIVYEQIYCYADTFDNCLKNLKQKVNKYCKKGWIPEGNVSMIKSAHDDIYACQAIVRKVNDEDSEIARNEELPRRVSYKEFGEL